MAMVKLRPAHINVLTKKKLQKSSVGPGGPNGLKMIFIPLTELIAVHMQLTIIHFSYFSLKRLLVLYWRLSRFLVCFQVGFYELFEQFISSS